MLGTTTALAACSSSSSPATTRWSELESAKVTVSQPGLPPPGGTPETTTYTTHSELARVTKALNANHIAKRSESRQSKGCTGGREVEIKIVRVAEPTHVAIHAYLCAGRQYGDANGDVEGFLAAL